MSTSTHNNFDVDEVASIESSKTSPHLFLSVFQLEFDELYPSIESHLKSDFYFPIRVKSFSIRLKICFKCSIREESQLLDKIFASVDVAMEKHQKFTFM